MAFIHFCTSAVSVHVSHAQRNTYIFVSPAQMVSMLAEPRLSAFYSPPKFELKLHCDVDTTRDDDQEDSVTWPDTGQLFGCDEEYQTVISNLTQCVSNSIDMVLEYSQVRLNVSWMFICLVLVIDFSLLVSVTN